MSPEVDFGALGEKEEESLSLEGAFSDAEPEEEVITTPKKPKESKSKERVVKQKQIIPSYIMLFNGRHGAGKTTAAELFDTPFLMDCERGKDTDAIPYSEFDPITQLRIGTMDDIEQGKRDIDVVDIQGESMANMWDNAEKVIEWYMETGYKNHRTFIIGKSSHLRKARTTKEEEKKGRRITKFEYRPITEDMQELIYDLIRHCRKRKCNLILISHWENKYEAIKRDGKYNDSEVVGEQPDVKDWIKQAVTWRIDFLKPDESDQEGRYIVYFDKAPRNQYKYVDITDQSLFEIINDIDSFNQAVKKYKETRELSTEGAFE